MRDTGLVYIYSKLARESRGCKVRYAGWSKSESESESESETVMSNRCVDR
jgi:hypothetical protein